MTIDQRLDAVNEQQYAIDQHGKRMASLGLMLGFLIGFAAAWLLAI